MSTSLVWLLMACAVIGCCVPLHAAEPAGEVAPFQTPLPESAAKWDEGKAALRAKLRSLMGDLPPMFVPKATVTAQEQRDGYTLEKFTFDNGAGATVYGYALVPPTPDQSATAAKRPLRPAILYNHWHGGQYKLGKDEMITPAFKDTLGDRVPAEELARAGFVVLGIDTYAFGPRNAEGPDGPAESGNQVEWSVAKLMFWQGRTMWGMIVRDDQLALNLLAGRADVDPARIGAMGVSMGATRSWWLAALDERVKATVSICCTTRYQELIAAKLMKAHGIYYFVPGLLKEHIDMEAVHGLIAPRALLTLNGDKDGTSPVAGVKIINHFCTDLYKLYGKPDDFRGVLYENTEHSYTKAMWDETLAWFKAKL
jgi:hypothetical protein